MKDYTVFRFPLRTTTSEISRNVWSPKDIEKLLQKFSSVAFEMLIFLKHITKICISEVTKNGELGPPQTFQVKISPEDESKKQQFYDDVNKFVTTVTNSENIQELTPSSVTYQIGVQGPKRKEDYVIVQQIGCDDFHKTMPADAIAANGLIPVGGVAARLLNRTHRFSNQDGRAYCYLPLPIETTAPCPCAWGTSHWITKAGDTSGRAIHLMC